MKDSRRRAFFASIAVALVLQSCTGASSGPATETASDNEPVVGNEIVLGMFSTFTGPAAAAGIPARDGVQVWISEVNAAGGINGRKLRLVSYDDAASPQEAISAARKLIDQDNVFALICLSGGSTLGVLPQIVDAKIPAVTCINATKRLIEPPQDKYVYRIYANEIPQSYAIADYLGGTLKSKRPAIIHTTLDFGVAGAKYSEEQLQSKYNTMYVAKTPFNVGDQDFTAQLLQIKQANPDALVVHALAADAGRIVRQAKDLGLNVPMVGGGATPTPLLPQAAGEASVGFVAPWVFPVLPDQDTPEVTQYTAKLKQYVYPNGLPPGRPSLYDMTGYIAGQVMGEALKRAGQRLTRTALLKVLDSLENFKPQLGFAVSFTKSHEGTDKVVMARIGKNLKWEIYTP